jgi:hypothetical protein
MLFIVFIVFVVLIGLALLLFCPLRIRAPAKELDALMLVIDPAARPSGSSVESLIPLLFYTEDLRDPLLQEDLGDRVISRRGARLVRIS